MSGLNHVEYVDGGKKQTKRQTQPHLGMGACFVGGMGLPDVFEFRACDRFHRHTDRDTISMGESATLTLTFEGGSPEGMPPLPNVPGLRVQDAGGDSTQISIVNGAVSRTASHTFMVTPTKEGTFSIPPMSATIDGQPYRSSPVKLTVIKAGTHPAAGAASKTAFIKLIIPKTEVYVGEILPVEIQVYLQNGQDLQMPRLNEEGFTLGKMVQSQEAASAMVDGQQLHVLTIKTYAVPAKVGALDYRARPP